MLNGGATFTVKRPIEKIKLIFNDKFSISVFLIILLSDLVGSILAGSKVSFFQNISKSFFDYFYNLVSCGSFLTIFITSFLCLTFFYLFEYFLCNGVFGFVFIFISAFFLGIFHGITAGYAYKTFGLQGITLNALLIVPFLIFIYLVFIYFSSECFLQSIDFLKIVFNKTTPELFNKNFKRLSIRLIFTVFLCVVLSVIFSVFSVLLCRFFILK